MDIGKVHYKLLVSSDSYEVIRRRQQASRLRQFMYWNLPAGVSEEDIQRHWGSINYGGPASKSPKAPLNPKLFRKPDKRIDALRTLAKKGKLETDRLALEHAVKRNIVWGQPGETASPYDSSDSTSSKVEWGT